MLVYVCGKYEQPSERDQLKEIMKTLARDLDNTYICGAIAFSYLPPPNIYEETERDIMREDLICACDKIIIATEINEDMRRDIYFAENLKIPIEYL